MGYPEEDRRLYEQVLLEIRWRVNEGLTNSRPPITRAKLEYAALHLRVILELIVFGSFVNNRRAIEALSSAFANKDVDEARKLARRVNPRYWPQGLTNCNEPEATRPDQLLETDWGRAFGFASDLLHARNPFAGARPFSNS